MGLTGSVPAWVEFAGIIGLQAAPQGADREVRFRVDERAWRIAVEEGEPGIAYIGWEAQSRDALGRIRDRLTAAGVSVKTDPELAAERNVLEVFSCEDPSGHRVEFFFGPEVSQRALRLTGRSPIRHQHGRSVPGPGPRRDVCR